MSKIGSAMRNQYSDTTTSRATGIVRSFFFLITLTLLLITGCKKSNDVAASSATPTPSVATSRSKPGPAANYVWGDVIKFGLGGDSERIKREGWSTTEEKMTWTVGNAAKLALTVSASDLPLTLRMRGAGFTQASVPTQPVEVLANGQKIADWQATSDPVDFTAVIPASIAKQGGELILEFKIPKAVSPKALGVSADPRVLGICCFELAITQGG